MKTKKAKMPFTDTKHWFTFRDGGMAGTYDIEKRRVQKREDIMRWVRHLSEKVWIGSEHVYPFVEAAGRHLKMSDGERAEMDREAGKIFRAKGAI